MSETFAQLITRVETNMAQVPGSSVQTYSEGRIAQYLQDSFDDLFLQRFWPEYTSTVQRTLDGATGRFTAPITGVNTIRDVYAVYYTGTNRKVPKLPPTVNPFSVTSGGVMFIDTTGPKDGYPFKIVSYTATGNVEVRVRTHPTPFAVDSVVLMDAILLTRHATWQLLIDDSTNPGATDKFKSLTETRLKLLIGADAETDMPLDPRIREYPTQWSETW